MKYNETDTNKWLLKLNTAWYDEINEYMFT